MQAQVAVIWASSRVKDGSSSRSEMVLCWF